MTGGGRRRLPLGESSFPRALCRGPTPAGRGSAPRTRCTLARGRARAGTRRRRSRSASCAGRADSGRVWMYLSLLIRLWILIPLDVGLMRVRACCISVFLGVFEVLTAKVGLTTATSLAREAARKHYIQDNEKTDRQFNSTSVRDWRTSKSKSRMQDTLSK